MWFSVAGLPFQSLCLPLMLVAARPPVAPISPQPMRLPFMAAGWRKTMKREEQS